MPSIELYVLLTAVAGNLILGSLPLLRNFKSATNKFFSFLTITIAVYLVANYLSLHQTDLALTTFWVRSVMSIALVLNLAFFLMANTYPNFTTQTSRWFLLISILVTAVLSYLAHTDLIFTSVSTSLGVIEPKPGPLIPLFLLHTLIGLGGGLYLLVRKYTKSEGSEKDQIKILLTGALLMFLLILVSNVVLVLMFNISYFVSFLPIYTIVFTGFVSYAIAKHGLFNLKVLATQLLVAILWIILLVRVFVASSFAAASVDILVFGTVVIFGVLLIRSVLAEVKQREKLQELTQKLQALDKQKDEFLSMAAHELRAPMTAIKGYVSMVLEGDTGDIPEKARGFLADTSNITDRLIRLVNNMLNVSRIEEGRLTFQEETEYLSVPVKSVFNQFVPEAERKGLKYTITIPNELKDKVTIDPDRIQEVIGNFISNAVKYTDEGFVKVVMLQPNESTVRVEVSDSGPGISKEEQKNLFQKFHRVESNVGKTTGTGLGLYISKLLMEKFKGDLGVDSEPGKGSTFWFELPLATRP